MSPFGPMSWKLFNELPTINAEYDKTSTSATVIIARLPGLFSVKFRITFPSLPLNKRMLNVCFHR